MNLPFSHDEFLAVFTAYNQQWWIAVLLLWLVTAVALWRLFRRGPTASRDLGLVLALLWGWSGVVYHLGYFRDINPAATLFGALFLVQASLLAWGAVDGRLRFSPGSDPWSRLGAGLLLYGLLYPLVVMAAGLRFPAMPTFGVPCPTAILTAGALLLAPARGNRPIAILTILWAVVGGSAAFTLGVLPDLALVVAAGGLIVYQVKGPHPTRDPSPGR